MVLGPSLQAKVDPTIPVLCPMDYTLSVATNDFVSLSFIPQADLNEDVGFRVRVCACDHLAGGGLPRFDLSMMHLFVRVFLFHGMSVLPLSNMTTGLATGLSPRWMEWLVPEEGKIQLRNIPRV